jgi:L-amino acid N-acyltransferase YncA
VDTQPVIDNITANDEPAVLAVYQEGIATGQATFETNAPAWDDWDKKHLAKPRLAARMDGRMVGWAALSAVSPRPVYAGVCEVSIYIAADYRGQGIGCLLMEALIEASENQGIWTLQAAIFPENHASRTLLNSAGFREVGIRERIAKHHGTWRNTLLLERRSPVVE